MIDPVRRAKARTEAITVALGAEGLEPHSGLRRRPFADGFAAKVREVMVGGAGAGDYELLGAIGEGGMGQIHQARQVALDRVIAIKRLRPDAERTAASDLDFLTEAVVTSRLDHPNIVPIHDLGVDQDGVPFYAMKKVNGTPWRERIRLLEIPGNLEILLKVCDAVAFAHSRGVIHRDLKPDNVMLGEFGEVLVMDWGMALAVADLRDGRSGPRLICGTPAYMAPEMARGDFAAIGPASDIYLLGAILFEIVTGESPHPGDDSLTILKAASDNVIEPAGQSGELAAIALRAMASAPEARYASVQDFQAAIHGYHSHVQSEDLVATATFALKRAGNLGIYADFARAVYGFEDALALWDGNAHARAGALAARLAYAERALAGGDLDLADSLLVDGLDDHDAVAQRVAAARAQRQRHQRRLRTLSRVSILLAVATVVALVGGILFANSERRQVLHATRERDAAEARLAEEESLRARQEHRSWSPLLHEDFSSGDLPAVLRVAGGAWVGRDEAIVATAAGRSVLRLAVPAEGDLRLQFDLVVPRPLTLCFGIAIADLPDHLAASPAAVNLGSICELRLAGQAVASVPLQPEIAGLVRHVRIEHVGPLWRVLIDGAVVLRHTGKSPSLPPQACLAIAADQGATIDNLKVESLSAPDPAADTTTPRTNPGADRGL